MDVSSAGSSDTALIMQRAAAGMQAPLDAIRQQENAALALSQMLAQSQPSSVPPSGSDLNGLGQVVDISA
jgi:hypothetical protein